MERKMKDIGKCSGCRNNVYNMQDFGGNNVNGKFRCWLVDSAIIVKVRLVPLDMRPPWDGLPIQKLPHCYHAKGYATVGVEKGKA